MTEVDSAKIIAISVFYGFQLLIYLGIHVFLAWERKKKEENKEEKEEKEELIQRIIDS